MSELPGIVDNLVSGSTLNSSRRRPSRRKAPRSARKLNSSMRSSRGSSEALNCKSGKYQPDNAKGLYPDSALVNGEGSGTIEDDLPRSKRLFENWLTRAGSAYGIQLHLYTWYLADQDYGQGDVRRSLQVEFTDPEAEGDNSPVDYYGPNSEDFFKGGNRIPWWAAGISIFATMLSAITYMSIPAKAYMTDWTYYPMQICILIVSFPVIRYFLPFFRRLNVTTAYEYLEHRFSYAIRLMASVLFIVFMVARMALVLFLPSLAMTAVTGIDIYVCIVVMAVVTIIYCTMGGVEAVVWGDVVQGIILVGGAFLAAAYLIFNTGNGPADFFQIASDNDKFRLFDWSFDYRTATFWVVILGGLANNIISYTSDQTVIQRYLTTKDERSAARSILTNGMMSVVVTIAFFTIGTGLYTFYQTHPMATDLTMQKTDAIFPFFMMSQLPAGVAGLLIAAVFAATMSTISSNINSISTAFTVDIWKKHRPQLSDKATVQTARLTGIVSGLIGMLIAILMATMNIQSLLDYFNTILGLLSGAVGALFIMGIFFPRIGARAAFVGFVAGTLTVFWMNFCTTANFLLFGFTAIVVSTLVALLLSLVWPERRPLKGFTWKTLE